MDEKMIQLDDELGRYLTAYQRTDVPDERERIFRDFIAALDAAITGSENEGTDSAIFLNVGYWFYRGFRINELWQWIRKVARDASGSRRISLEVGLLEGISEDEPPDPNQLIQLFDCMVDPELQWMIAAAYENYPERLHAHFCNYLQLKGRRE